MSSHLTRPCRLVVLLLLAVCTCRPSRAAKTPPPDIWVGTWGASAMAMPSRDTPPFGSTDMTLRAIVHTSLGGPMLRVVLSNEFGTDPLTVGEVHAALAGKAAGSIGLFSANALTFNGSTGIIIPPGARAVSDPFALSLPFGVDLAISVFVPAQPLHTVSGHSFADQTSYVAPGNLTGKADFPADAQKIGAWPFVKGVEVLVPATSGAVVCFGDSITDGAASTRDANRRWPDILARRLHDNGKTKQLAIINEGIGGNRVLLDGFGPNALARFDRDVLTQSGVRYLIFLEAINDIGVAFNPQHPPDTPLTVEELTSRLIQGYAQMAARAHGHGIRVYGATLTPYMGAGYSSPSGEQVRQAVNQWIRTSHVLDGFIDFDKATQDPAKPDTFSPAADSGDHLHPKDAGYRMMGDSIDLKMFSVQKEKWDIKWAK